MTSFLMVLNEEKTNGYFLFTVWHYNQPHWLDEFDPAYIHLGVPLGDYVVRDGVAFREYEDGWGGGQQDVSEPSHRGPGSRGPAGAGCDQPRQLQESRTRRRSSPRSIFPIIGG